MNDCKKIRHLLVVQSTNWSADEQDQIETHLGTCPDCTTLAQVYAEQDWLIRNLPRAVLTPAQRGQFLSQIQQERKRHKMLSKPLAILGTVAAALVLVVLGFGVQTLLENGQATPAAPATQPTEVEPTQSPTVQATQPPTAVATPQKSPTAIPEFIFIWPVEGHITQPYSPEHYAIDIAAEEGTPVVAAASGTVVAAEWANRHGYLVALDHGDGMITRYTHLLDFQVEVGDQVEQGQQIGRVGSTGESTGPHLHFEIFMTIDPALLLNKPDNPYLKK